MVDFKKLNEAKAATAEPEKKPPTLKQLAGVYVKMRDKKLAMKHEFEAEEAKLVAKMDMIEVEMLKILNAQDASSIRTDHGTVIRSEDIKPAGSDWATFYDWVKENDAFDALERRIKKTFVKEYMESHEGAPPPGVSVLREFKVTVRRNS